MSLLATKLPQVFIVGAKRTAVGAFGGAFKEKSQEELAVAACVAALAEAKVSGEKVDTNCWGNVVSSTVTGAYLARHVSLKSGISQTSKALTVNRLCGSGFESIIQVSKDIVLGEASIGVGGGVEVMSGAPYAAYNIRWGVKLGQDPKLQDVLWSSLTDAHINSPMGMTAEKLAEQYKLTRVDCDNYALRSQKSWAAASAAGHFAQEICPVPVKTKKGVVQFTTDEHGRADTTLEGLAKLPTVFKKDGVVTAGNASGICDGAGAVVVASAEAVKTHGLTPLARIVGWHVAGVDPSIMGIGPVPAIRGLLKQCGNMKLEDIDLIEINEAFAAQYLSCEKELGLDRNKVNCEGGAIAIGHPLGASGSRIITHLVHTLHRKQKKYAIGSACIGGGQGIAILLERT